MIKLMLNNEKFNEIADGDEIATGTIIDSPEGINMTNSTQMLRWVAVKGYGDDWCIYIHFAHNTLEWIKSHGDKIVRDYHIKKLVPCTDEVFKKYRY